MAKFCGYCGSKLPDDAKVCGYCGKPVSNSIVNTNTQKKSMSNILTIVLVFILIGGCIAYFGDKPSSSSGITTNSSSSGGSSGGSSYNGGNNGGYVYTPSENNNNSGSNKKNCPYCKNTGMVDCPKCLNGSGQCQKCNGRGEVHSTYLGISQYIKCTSCNGNGRCSYCNGKGEKTCLDCN